MEVQKTYQHGGRTIEHGTFQVREIVYVCAAGCRHPSGVLVTERPDSVVTRIMPNSVVGYDVMVFVGLQRFCGYRQREEIRSELLREHGVRLSTGEVSRLAKSFLVYLKALHESRAGHTVGGSCRLASMGSGRLESADRTGGGDPSPFTHGG
jgi:hypothetical protein